MVSRRWVDEVEYYEYTPETVEYSAEFNAFTIARADVHSPITEVRLALRVVIREDEVTRQRLSGQEVISRGRVVLDRVLGQHRELADELDEDAMFVFDFAGQRIA
jgi:hypothetical protein